MGNRLYVGNLPYDADEDAIRTAFTEAGASVGRVHIPLDRETQRPRGFAFVEVASEQEVAQVIAALDGSTFGTRTLRVSEAEDRRPPGGGAPPRAAYGGDRERPPRHEVDGAAGAPREADGERRDPADVARENRERRFGPDARPRRDRDRGRKGAGPGRRRHEGDSGRGRRGGGGGGYDYDDE